MKKNPFNSIRLINLIGALIILILGFLIIIPQPQENSNVFFEKNKTNIPEKPVVLRRCVSDDIGIAFKCDPSWKLNRQGKALEVTISESPLIKMSIEENQQKVHFMSELNKAAFASMGRYEEGFHFEHLTRCNRETVKINGYLKGHPQTRVSDFYLIDHLHLHSVKFTVDPKESWEDHKWLIKELIDSVSFTKHTAPVKFHPSPADETCEDLIEKK